MNYKSWIIGQKGKSPNECYTTQRTPNFLENKYFSPPDTHTYVCVSGGKNCSFFGKFGMLYFFVTRVLRFALLTYYPQNYRKVALC